MPKKLQVTGPLPSTILLSAALALLLAWGGIDAKALTTAPSMKFDFGSESSPVADGYLRVANTTLYASERGYGLDRATEFRDRGEPDDLRRDFTNASDYGFAVDVPNGDYHVRIVSGDWIASNNTSVSVEGEPQETISSRSGGFSELNATVTVSDGQMNLDFGRDGRVNAVEITPIFAPTGLRVEEKSLTPEPSVTLAWQPVEGAEGYNIYRSRKGEDAFNRIGSSTSASYTDETTELGLTYVYAVTQVNRDGLESARSKSLTVPIKDDSVPAPAKPTGLALETATQGSLTLRWDAVDEALKYYVYRGENAGGPFDKVASAHQPRYTDGVEPTINHYYRVVAVNEGGLSEPSGVLKTPITKVPLRQMENLDRGMVAVRTGDGVFVGWRMLGTDPENISFNLYRDGEKVNDSPIVSGTGYLDPEGTTESNYHVRAILDGKERPKSGTANVWDTNHLDVPLQKPEGGTTPDGVSYTYSANDASVGNLDGDGQYEIVLKWDPSNSKDNSRSGYTGEVFLDAYELNGERLWRIGLGRNIRAGAHYTQFLVYDLDGDGKAEIVSKTADGTTDGAGKIIGDPKADYRNEEGRILEGPEYLTVFDGKTGRELATTNYEPPRGNVCDWGDCYGNRVDRFLGGVAYLDGERPTFVMARGYYTRTVLAAYNWRDGKLTRLWTFDSDDPGNEGYAGQGNHQLSVGDVDGDGRDEIVYGAMAVDDDGTGLYTTGLGHGDAMHLSDLDPDRPGLEVFQVHEDRNADYGLEFREAGSGEAIWGVHTGRDTGRGLAADVDPRHRGAESWAVDGAFNSPTGGLYTADGERISTTIPPANFAIWWDADLRRELLDHNWSAEEEIGVGTIGKWNHANNRTVNLLTADGTYSNNHTKGNPSLQADILGDWREEAIWRTEGSSALRIYTTTEPTEHRLYTLMHDPVYRLGVAWQNVGYNQPPHTSFYLGTGMEDPPRPLIHTGGVVPASVDMDPDTWGENGPGVATAYVELPAGRNVSLVVSPTVRLLADGEVIASRSSPVEVSDHNRNGVPDLMVKFDGRAFASALAEYSGTVEVSVTGRLTDGRAFVGSDSMKVRGRDPKRTG